MMMLTLELRTSNKCEKSDMTEHLQTGRWDMGGLGTEILPDWPVDVDISEQDQVTNLVQIDDDSEDVEEVK